MKKANKLNLVIPCFNEEKSINDTALQLIDLLQSLQQKGYIGLTSNIIFVDDGSKDNSWEIINKLSTKYDNIVGIKLARNYGHQNALLAGLFSVNADYYISLDADLQDDISVIETMLINTENNDIVYGVRKNRDTDSLFKRLTANYFYKLMDLLGCELIENHADFRLMSHRAIEHLKTFRETNLFLRGLIPLLGFNSTSVYYDRKSRQHGTTKYSLMKMLALAWNGITSLSIVPIRLITVLGFIIFVASLFMSTWALYLRLLTDQTIPGWTSTVLPIYFIGGIQLFSLGIVGEYIGKIYLESKRRPRFCIEEQTKK